METKRETVPLRTGLAPQAIFVGGLFAVVLVLLTWGSSPQKAAANTLEVGGGGYATISAAVQAAAPADTILIHAGTYPEEVAIDKGIILDVFGDGDVWVDGQCLRKHGFWIWGDGATLRSIRVKNTVEAAVFLYADRPDQQPPSNVTVEGMTIQDFDCTWSAQDPATWGQYRAGIASWYGGPGMRIINNLIQHRTVGSPYGAADGIWFKSNDSKPSGGGHHIAGNTIIGGWDGIGGEEEGSHHGTFDRDTIVENNTIQNTWDDCIQSEGGDQDVIIRGNDLSGCGTGIAFAAPVTGPLYLENNYIHDLVTGLYDNHFCYKVGQGGGGTTYMTGNTCEVTAAPGQEADGIHQTSENLSPIVSKRNIYRVSRYIFTMGYPSIPSGTDFDEDCMWTTNENLFKWNNVYYTNLARFQQATGQERNGRLAQDCSFLGTPTPPAASSPAAPTTPGAPQSTPTAAGQTPSAQPTPAPAGQTPSVRPTSTPEETAGSDDDVLTSPVALGLEALAGLTLLGLGFIVGVRWSRRHRPAP